MLSCQCEFEYFIMSFHPSKRLCYWSYISFLFKSVMHKNAEASPSLLLLRLLALSLTHTQRTMFIPWVILCESSGQSYWTSSDFSSKEKILNGRCLVFCYYSDLVRLTWSDISSQIIRPFCCHWWTLHFNSPEQLWCNWSNAHDSDYSSASGTWS